MSAWSVISNIASVLTIISAAVTVVSALAMKNYYTKIVNQYSVEKVTVAEQKSLEAKKEYQKIKKMYANPRGIRKETFSGMYIIVDDMLDDIQHNLPVGYNEISTLIKLAKERVNEATEPQALEKRSDAFLDLGRCRDSMIDKLKVEKATLQKQNIKNTKGVG